MFGRTFLLCLVCFYEVERKRREIVVLVSQVEKSRDKKMVARALSKCGEGISKSSGTIRATNRRDGDDRMK
jgi:hypothetical protein